MTLFVVLAVVVVVVLAAAWWVVGPTETPQHDESRRAGDPDTLDPHVAAQRAGGRNAWMRLGGGGDS